ncbi:MAG: type II toxin-antitoxin system VapB family antitoxin [Caulobacterales bacterium]|jgi:antitoxin VapB
MTMLELETDEADRLAHELSALTGESVTAVVTKALATELARARAAREEAARILAAAAQMREHFDLSRPVTKAEWDEACGDVG